MTTLYGAVGGFDPILALVRRWHRLCLDDPRRPTPSTSPDSAPTPRQRSHIGGVSSVVPCHAPP